MLILTHIKPAFPSLVFVVDISKKEQSVYPFLSLILPFFLLVTMSHRGASGGTHFLRLLNAVLFPITGFLCFSSTY